MPYFTKVFSSPLSNLLEVPTGLVGGMPPFIKWWEINSLEEADIVDAWSFDYFGDELIGRVNGMAWTTIAGTPTIQPWGGLVFNGDGAMEIDLPSGLDANQMSVIIEFTDAVKNSSLDGFFSQYDDPTRIYTLQHNFDSGIVRWAAGGTGVSTIEVPRADLSNGVYGVSGPKPYINGEYKNTCSEVAGPIADGSKFMLGAISVSAGAPEQFIKATIKKIILVKRRLTEYEQHELYYKIMYKRSPKWYEVPGIDPSDVVYVGDYKNAKNMEDALKAIVGPDLQIESGTPYHILVAGLRCNATQVINTVAPVTVTPGEATLIIKENDPETVNDWRALCGFEIVGAGAVLLQHKQSVGVTAYNGKWYVGGEDNYSINPPSAQQDEWLAIAGDILYRNGVAADDKVNVQVQPEGDFTLGLGHYEAGNEAGSPLNSCCFTTRC